MGTSSDFFFENNWNAASLTSSLWTGAGSIHSACYQQARVQLRANLLMSWDACMANRVIGVCSNFREIWHSDFLTTSNQRNFLQVYDDPKPCSPRDMLSTDEWTCATVSSIEKRPTLCCSAGWLTMHESSTSQISLWEVENSGIHPPMRSGDTEETTSAYERSNTLFQLATSRM